MPLTNCPYVQSASSDTYSTLPGNYDATTVATKVGNDFQFRGLHGINGITVTPNGNVIDIGVVDGTTLQTAYNAGNQIITAGGLPVSIISTNQPALSIRDSGPTGLFSVSSVASAVGDARIVVAASSGLILNRPVSVLTAPTAFDPYMQLQVAAPPTANNNTDTIQSAANIGAATNVNDVYFYTSAGLSDVVVMIDLDVVGYSAALNSSFTIKALAKLSPTSPSPVILINTFNAIDPALAGISIDVRYFINVIHFDLIGGPVGVDYLVRSSARVTVLTY